MDGFTACFKRPVVQLPDDGTLTPQLLAPRRRPAGYCPALMSNASSAEGGS